MDDAGGRTEAAYSRLARAADAADARRWAKDAVADGALAPGRVARAWANVKLAGLGITAPIGVPVVAVAAARSTAAARRATATYPALLDRAMAGSGPVPVGAGRVGRAPAGNRYFMTSDLHRFVRGANDWPARQGTRGLYERVLDHYADGGWGLVENGDVEDFWLVGGSTYGTAYDAARLAGGALGRAGRRLRRHVAGEHLRRVVANNQGIYDRIADGFHRHGRYHRLVGNHDDCYLDDATVDHLRSVLPGLAVHDLLVLDGPDAAVGLVAHGHHTDTWNTPHRSGLGRLGTWAGSAVNDTALVSSSPGLPTPEQTRALLDADRIGRLTEVDSRTGTNGLYTLDEEGLFHAFRERFGAGGPYLVLGHTHLPLAAPLGASSDVEHWDRYLNSGCGILHEMVTGVEWDGTGDAAHPHVRIVAWHPLGPEDEPDDARTVIVGELDGRPVARTELEAVSDLPRAAGVHRR